MPQNFSLTNVEFFRNSFILISNDHNTHLPLLSVTSARDKKPRLFCRCSRGSYAACFHARELKRLFEQMVATTAPELPHKSFQNSDIYSIFKPLIRHSPKPLTGIKSSTFDDSIKVGKKGSDICIECSPGESTTRYLERLGLEHDTVTTLNRLAPLSKTKDFVYTEGEKQLLSAGHKTVRMAEEESIWFRTAYHLYREIGTKTIDMEISIQKELCITFFMEDNRQSQLTITVPRSCVSEVLQVIEKIDPERLPFSIDKTTSRFLFHLSYPSADKVSFEPAVRLSDTREDYELFSPENVFGSMVYLPSKQRFTNFDQPGLGLLAQGWSEKITTEQKTFSTFLEKHASAFSLSSGSVSGSSSNHYDLFSSVDTSESETHDADFGRLANLPCFKEIEEIEIEVINLRDQWCTLSITYFSPGAAITLKELLSCRKEKRRFFITSKGFFDCESEGICAVIPFQDLKEEGDNRFQFPHSALMQFVSRNKDCRVTIKGDKELRLKLETLTQFRKPQHVSGALPGFTSKLRPYQENGLAWLLFLYDNGFGGLLCDDMGLGKTHQVLAFITALKEQRNNRLPVLVICPVSVIGHWQRLCATFAPGLKSTVYHGSGRSTLDFHENQLVITSYGVLRADCETLCESSFEVAVFDEAQRLKNAQTAVSKSAEALRANMKLGLSGTPVENSLSDLKRLFDIVLPGYLGSDRSFGERFLEPIEVGKDLKARELLRISITPFILRRLKESVLLELPPKIEDNRICSLSDEQHSLYKDAFEKRGEKLIESIGDKEKAVPYLHVFSLLKHLKEVCNHPALALKDPDGYANHQSGKWELFTEIMDEALGSGQKVVVFSQYLGMIEIIRQHLETVGVGHVVLTGSSKNRDRLINRFNEDEGCRVFVGSLKAGGVGIDLVAASVVIHYDRWWNSAAEDQATDRVHRIGQKRGVQVFRLITEDTLEEKIDRIISRKKELASMAVSEDSPDVVKSFSRDEILELLSWNKEKGIV
ncbi:DEAD/DEAH box helicase [Chitinispirillales bacterium ANBcel5]|uniref:DEAD/DEAH box helicase n=1 Tax=Cellulosispirillum alkaliphilum TaxID=3039283 RepID=UPI002A5058CB|nr:DEAD/DEAH box helicase [Chitinispirillales bacterium ANBcel5]